VKALAKISSGSPVDLRAGTLRRRDLKTFDTLLVELGGTGTVLVTGAAERKRAGAIGLAAAAAAGGTKTALLECDLAAPALAGELGLAAEPGLHEYLRWEATATQIPVATWNASTTSSSQSAREVSASRLSESSRRRISTPRPKAARNASPYPVTSRM